MRAESVAGVHKISDYSSITSAAERQKDLEVAGFQAAQLTVLLVARLTRAETLDLARQAAAHVA